MVRQLRTALDPPFERLGYAIAEQPSGSVTYFQRGWKEVLLAVSFGVRASGAVEAVYMVDPLIKRDGVRLLFPEHGTGAGQEPPPIWRLSSPAWSGESVARFVDHRMQRLRQQYGNPKSFVERIDDEYLSDDNPELAEAVAYMCFRAGLIDMAVARLRDLAVTGTDIPVDISERARWFDDAIRSQPSVAEERLRSLAADVLRGYGLSAEGRVEEQPAS